MKNDDTLECQYLDASMDELFQASGMTSRELFERSVEDLFERRVMGYRNGRLFIVLPQSLHLLTED